MIDAGDSGSGNAGAGGSFSGDDGGTRLVGLDGADVQFSVHCCTNPPSNANIISAVVTGTVGATIEFPSIAGTARPGFIVADADVGIDSRSIDLTYLEDLEIPASSTSAAFNGYVFEFSGGDLPPITGVAFGPETTPGLEDLILVTSDGDTVVVNVTAFDSRGIFVGDRISLLLSF